MGKARQVAGLLLLTVVVILAVSVGAVLADFGKPDIQAYCYIGDRGGNRYVGTVRVLDFTKAASHCNVL